MVKIIVSYMQFRGRGRNRRIGAYCFFGVMILGLIYFYPRKKYFREDTEYQVEDLKKKAERFVNDHVSLKEFFDSEEDYDEDWKDAKFVDEDDNDDDNDDDDDNKEENNQINKDKPNDELDKDSKGKDTNEEMINENEKNKWVKDADYSRKKKGIKEDDLLEAPDVEAGVEEHNDKVEAPDVNDQIADRNDVELPDEMMEDKEGDDVQAPDPRNNNAQHRDDVKVPHGAEDNNMQEVKQADVADENLDAPDVNNKVEEKRDNLNPPEDVGLNAGDNLAAPNPEEKDLNNDDVIAPEAADEIKDNPEENKNGNNNINVPNLENINDKQDNVEQPIDVAGKANDLKAPDVNELNLHQNDLKAPEGLDAQKGIAADAVEPVVEGHVNVGTNDVFKAKNINGRSLGTCNSERVNLVYIKNIKCASETMVSMLRRFGYNRELNFVQPLDKRIYVGWPYQIDPGYYRANKGKEFNILCEHSVFNKTILSKLMPQNTVYVTSIREPYNQVKSMFKYYRLTECLGLEKLIDPFTEYIRNVEKYETIYKQSEKRVFRHCIPDNFSMSSDLMSFNLGFPTAENGMTEDRTHDDVYINDWLKEIDNSFSLIMIVEYFDESLILLKRLMCWSWKDIMYYSSNVLNYGWKQDANPENIKIYKERSRVDYKLYDYFNQTFWRRINNEKNDFWGEVREYKKIWKEVHDYCEQAPNHMIYNLQQSFWSTPFSINKQDCTDFVHYYQIFLRIKERYDKTPVEVVQPPMKINVC